MHEASESFSFCTEVLSKYPSVDNSNIEKALPFYVGEVHWLRR